MLLVEVTVHDDRTGRSPAIAWRECMSRPDRLMQGRVRAATCRALIVLPCTSGHPCVNTTNMRMLAQACFGVRRRASARNSIAELDI